MHDGDYYRLLTPGDYIVTADQEGYQPQTQRVTVTEKFHQPAHRLDFKLTPLPPVSFIRDQLAKEIPATFYYRHSLS